MPIASHIFRRGAVYNYRRRWPRSLAKLDTFQTRRHVLINLATTDPRRARSLGVALDAKFEEIIMLAEANFLSPEKVGEMLRWVVRDHSMHIDRSVAAEKSFPGFDASNVERSELQNGWTYKLFDAQSLDAAVRPQDREKMRAAGLTDAEIDGVAERIHQWLCRGTVPIKHNRLVELLKLHGAEPTAMNLALAQQAYLRGRSLAHFETGRRFHGEVPDAPVIVAAALRIDHNAAPLTPVANPSEVTPVVLAPPLATALPQQPPTPAAVPCAFDDHPVRLAAQKLIAHNAAHETWNIKGQNDARQIYRLFVMLLIERGVFTIKAITQADFAAYKTLLSELPKSHGKSKADARRTLEQLRDRDNPDRKRGLGARTNNKHLSRLSGLVEFMQGEGLMQVEINFKRLRITNRKRSRDLTQTAKPKRLQVLFNLPCLTGCASAEEPFEAGPNTFHDANYFGPMLMHYLGGRREEMFGFRVAEVILKAPVPYFKIVPNDYRGLKTLASPRLIPIHPELLRLNFGLYVQAVADLEYDLLFPELRWGRSTMPLGDRFYKNFQEGLDLIRLGLPDMEGDENDDEDPDVQDDKQPFVFRQMRKAFGAVLKARGVHSEERADLMGHAGENVGQEVYADAVKLARKLKLINKIPIVTGHLNPQPIQLLPWVRDHLPPPDARGREREERRSRC